MSLTDVAIRRAKARSKPYKLFDAGGLYILVTPSGGKWWRFKYRYAGKEKLLSLGTYPTISLKDARDRRDVERRKLADRIDPAMNRAAAKAAWAGNIANSFEVVAREWVERKSAVWSATNTAKTIRRLEVDVFPWLGSRPIADIAPPDLLTIIQRTEKRGALDTAHRVLQTCGQIFRYAVATGRAQRDPSFDLRGALPPAKGSHFAAVTEPKAIAPLLRALNGYQGSVIIRCALRLAPLVFVRPGELRKAEWTEIDWESASWNVPPEQLFVAKPIIDSLP